MSQHRSKVNGKVVEAFLDLRGKQDFVVVKLDDGVQFDFPAPTIQEIRDKFFFKKAKTQPDKPARPPNKFFIFRSIFQAAICNLKLQVPTVSSLASEVWKKCTPEVIELFTKLSNIAKIEHGYINPGYVYKPNRKHRHTKPPINPGTLMSPMISLSCSPTAPIWTSPSRPNSFMQQESRPSISFALQTNSFTTFENFPTFPTQYTYTMIDPPIHYMSPNESTHIHYQHSQHPNLCISHIPHNDVTVDQFSAFRNAHDINTILSTRKNDNVTSKESSLAGQPLDRNKIMQDIRLEREDKNFDSGK
ncbi:hypothetical protein RclHR1_02870013 [Rhizophagus clarus]|uniref:HMG box domain-containing protein n=1 Tax=Rhizophagus clarus TaxID=94130 RepID=A0A2Z6R4F4_9GLOM|nr:hypothetical protein RclHR1_02870013 [Rhizophagus clarus]GES80103.1 hypothetical protein GLOIN_2v1839503 [Rhizophagus clarus]